MQTNRSKEVWVKPTITAHRMGALNKFGTPSAAHYKDNIDGVPVAGLIEQYGSPLYVVSETQLRANIKKLYRAFETRYPNVTYGWSYKTNYLGAICSALHQEGAWAEVVSAFEYEKARKLGVPAQKILFNGPHKERPILERVVKEGARVHIDHLDELYLLDEIAKQAEKEIDVTIRLNFDTGYTEPWSRFGFNIESGQAMDAARILSKSKNLNLTGLHSHLGTFITDPRAYEAQIRIMCAFMDTIEAQADCHIESIDIGGGFASLNSLQGTYLPPEQVVPSFDQYAEVICTALIDATRERELAGRDRPRLILESGRSIVDDSEVLITSVVGVKRLPDGRRSVVLDAGVNLLFTAFWYNHNVISTRPLEGIAEDTVLYGALCMNIDVMRASIMLPPVKVGDTLIFSPVGAYNNTQSMQFIEYRPNVLMIDTDKTPHIIRKAEDLEVIISQELLPPHLREPAPNNA